MNTDERIRSRLDELVKMGEMVLATQESPGPRVIGDDRVDVQLAYQRATSVQNLIVRIFGQGSEHYKSFTAQVSRCSYLCSSEVSQAQGILKAAKDDYDHGQLFDVRRLVEVEVFDDFLEQAEYLLETGYYEPAAVIAGCVLEDGLRKLCERNEIALSSRPKLDTMRPSNNSFVF